MFGALLDSIIWRSNLGVIGVLVLQKIIYLSQIILNLIYRPPKSNKVACYSILCQAKSRWVGNNNVSDYLRRYTCTRDLDWLNNEDVHLFNVTDSEFIFARITPGIDVFNVTKHPFSSVAISDHVEEFGVISTDLAIDFAENLKCVSSNITLVHNTGRCGSTLVANMLHKTGQCRVISEVGPIQDISSAYNMNPAMHSDSRTVAKLRAALLFTTRDSSELKYIIKLQFLACHIMHLFQPALPGIREIFLYRSMKPLIRSTMVSFEMFLPITVFKCVLISNGFKSREFIQHIIDSGADTSTKMMLGHLIDIVQRFFALAANRDDLMSYSYESLIENPEAFTSHLLEQVGLSSKWTELALTAMEEDSQKNNVWLNRKAVAARAKKTKVVLDEESAKFIRDYAEREHGILLVGENLEITDMPCQWNKETFEQLEQ